MVLLLVSVFLAFKHGWDSFQYKKHPESLKMMTDLGIDKTFIPAMGISMMIIGVLLLIPKTFFIGNLLNAMTIVLIMALSLNAGNYKIALMEIPFLAMPLFLIWLKYPFKS